MSVGFLGRAKFHLSRCGCGLVVVLEPRMNTDDHGWVGVLLESRKTRITRKEGRGRGVFSPRMNTDGHGLSGWDSGVD